MPYVFKVTESAGIPVSYFAYAGPQARIGDASAFGLVFHGTQTDAQGNPEMPGNWVIKESSSPDHLERFHSEFAIMCDLAAKTRDLRGIAFSPFPVYFLQGMESEQPGIAMPFYPITVRDVIENWDEEQIVTTMINYLDVLRALHDIGHICTDRKVDDLRWQDGTLVVIDWNVLRAFEETSVQAEIDLTVRLWYLLLTSYEPTARLNPFSDDEWQPFNAPREGGRISIGLRLILAHALLERYPTVDALHSALLDWRSSWLASSPLDDSDPRVVEKAQTQFGLSKKKARALIADLAWRAGLQTASVRQSLLASILEQADELDDIRDTLDSASDALLGARFDNARQLVAALYPQGAVQSAAVERWKLLIETFPALDREEREELRNRYGAALLAGLRRLARALEEDEAAESLQTLHDIEDAYTAALASISPQEGAGLAEIHREIELRRALLDLTHIRREQPDQPIYTQLQHALELAQQVRYVDWVLDLHSLQAELEVARRSEQIREGVDLRTHEMEKQAASILSNWRAPAPLPDLSAWLERNDQIEREFSRHTPQLTKFTAAVQPYRHLFRWLPGAMERTPREVAQQSQSVLEQISETARPALTPALGSLVEYVTAQYLAPIDEGLAKGDTGSLSEVMRRLTSINDGSVRHLISQELTEHIDRAQQQIDNYRKLVEFIREKNHLDVEIVQQAQQLGISPISPIVKSHFDKMIQQSAAESRTLQGEFEAFRAETTTEFKREVSRLQKDVAAVQKSHDDFRAEFERAQAERWESIDGRLAATENSVNALNQRGDTLEKSVRGLRLPIIAGFAVLVVLLLGLSVFILSVNSGVTAQTSSLQTQAADAATEQVALQGTFDATNLTGTAAANQERLNLQMLAASGNALSTASALTQMATIQQMIDQSIQAKQPTAVPTMLPTQPPDTPPPQAGSTSADTTPEATAAATNPPTPIPLDRSTETLASAQLTPEEAAQLGIIMGSIQPSAPYVLQFSLDDVGNLRNFIQPSSDSELAKLMANRITPAIASIKSMKLDYSNFTVQFAVRQQDNALILYPLLHFSARYNSMPANSAQVFPQQANAPVYFGLVLDPKVQDAAVGFVSADAALITALQPMNVTLPAAGEMLVAQVTDGHLSRILLANGLAPIDAQTRPEAALLLVIPVQMG